jgi:hypothetical protein
MMQQPKFDLPCVILADALCEGFASPLLFLALGEVCCRGEKEIAKGPGQKPVALQSM